MEENHKAPKYMSILEVNNCSEKLERSNEQDDLLVGLLVRLELAAEGAYGYITDAKTGDVLQSHRKVAAL